MPRILVLSASVGGGHLRAAEAVELALREMAPEATVRNVDVLSLTNATFRRVYAKTYFELVKKAPHLVGYFYDRLDRPKRRGRSKGDRLRLLVQKLNLRKFTKLLKDEPWDAIVNTHFLPAELVASLRRRRKIKTPQVIATTDFETHRLWVHEPCEHYFTATAEGAAYLGAFGVEPARVTATGIPIHPAFGTSKSGGTWLAENGLSGDRPVVLQLAGGFGVGPIEDIFRAILAIERPLDIVVVTGRNAAAKKTLARIRARGAHRVRVLGFTDRMDEIMAAADLAVTKPGGLTTSEALARSVPLAIVDPIPGQESRNSDFLLENGAAIKVNHLATLAYKIGGLLAEPRRLSAMKQRARLLGRPRAAFTVALAALKLAEVCKGEQS